MSVEMTLKLTGHGWKRRHDAGRPREVNLCGDDVGRHPVQKFPLGPVEHDRVQSALPQVPQPPHVGDLRERRHSLPPWRALSVELHPLPQPLLLRNLLRHRRAALLERSSRLRVELSERRGIERASCAPAGGSMRLLRRERRRRQRAGSRSCLLYTSDAADE